MSSPPSSIFIGLDVFDTSLKKRLVSALRSFETSAFEVPVEAWVRGECGGWKRIGEDVTNVEEKFNRAYPDLIVSDCCTAEGVHLRSSRGQTGNGKKAEDQGGDASEDHALESAALLSAFGDSAQRDVPLLLLVDPTLPQNYRDAPFEYADDILCRPLRPKELCFRIHMLLQRTREGAAKTDASWGTGLESPPVDPRPPARAGDAPVGYGDGDDFHDRRKTLPDADMVQNDVQPICPLSPLKKSDYTFTRLAPSESQPDVSTDDGSEGVEQHDAHEEEVQPPRQSLRSSVSIAKQRLGYGFDAWCRMVEDHPAPIQITVDGVIQYVNPAGASFFGARSPQEVIGKPVFDFIISEHVTQRMKRRAELIRRGIATTPCEHKIQDLSGERRVIETYSIPILYGGTPAAQTFFRDLTEERRQQRKLSEREALLQGIAHSIPGVLLNFCVPEGADTAQASRTIFVSRQTESILGLSAEPVETHFARFSARIPDRFRERFDRSLTRAIQSGSSWQFETLFDHPDGTHIWLRCQFHPKRQHGKLMFNGVLLDITDRIEARRALDQERHRLETLFENLPSPVVLSRVRDGKAYVQATNASFEEVFGIDRQTAVGMSVERLIVPNEYQDEAQQINRKALEEGTTESEVRRCTREGVRDFQLHVAGRTFNDGQSEVFGIYTDITHQKERERVLRQAKQRAEEAREAAESAHQMKSSFLANMSHEIRTPLTSVIGFAEAIGEEIQSSLDMTEARKPSEQSSNEDVSKLDLAQLRRFAALIEQSGDRLMETLNGVLNFSKLEAGVMRFTPEAVCLGTHARESVVQFEPQACSAGLDLHIDVSTDSSGAEVQAWANPHGVDMVLRNLLSNAIKYTDAGGDVWVRVREASNATVHLEVEDTGIGMHPDLISHLFKAFQQESQGLGREFEGTGLGLAIIDRAVQEMNGSISVDSDKGEGTRITVMLPQAGRSGTPLNR